MSEKNNLSDVNSDDLLQVANLHSSSAEMVEAELVRMHQSIVQEITAEEIELHQSAAFDVTTANLNAHETAIGMVSASEVQMTNSAVGAIRAENVTLTGHGGAILADSVSLGNTYAGVVAGREVRGERINTLLLLSNHIEGNIQTVVDTRGALLAGLTGGLAGGLLLLVGRFLLRRKA